MKAATLFIAAASRGRTQSGVVHGARAINGSGPSWPSTGRPARRVAFPGIYWAVCSMHGLSAGKSGVYKKPSMSRLPFVLAESVRIPCSM